MSAVALISGIGLFACGVALTLLLGYRWVHNALQDSYTDGARSMLDAAKSMQAQFYLSLSGSAEVAAREAELQAIDALVIGLQDEMNQLLDFEGDEE